MKTVSYSTLAQSEYIMAVDSTPTEDTSYGGEDFSFGGIMRPARTITITLGANAGSYVDTSEIVIVGTDKDGAALAENLMISGTDGGATLVTTVGFTTVTEVIVPAQEDGSGTISVGVRDIVCDPNDLPVGLRCGGSGDLKLGYSDGTTDTIQTLVGGSEIPASPSIVYGDSDTTATKLTLFFATRPLE